MGSSVTSSGHTAAADEEFFAQYIITAQRRLILALERSLPVPKPWAQFWPFVVRNSRILSRADKPAWVVLDCPLQSKGRIVPSAGLASHSMARRIKSERLQAPNPEKRLCDNFNNIFLPGHNQRKLVCLFVSRCSYLITRAAWQKKLPFKKHCSLPYSFLLLVDGKQLFLGISSPSTIWQVGERGGERRRGQGIGDEIFSNPPKQRKAA